MTDIRDNLSSLVKLDRSEKQKHACAILESLIESGGVKALLRQFRDEVSRAKQHEYHSDSYTHDNGFDKIVLSQIPESKIKLRLHIWYPVLGGYKRTPQNIHNHRWDFSSAILLGEVSNVQFDFADEGEVYQHYRYFARGSKEHYDLRHIGVARLRELRMDKKVAGQVYSTSGEKLHRVDIPDGLHAATLVLTHENMNWFENDLLSKRLLSADDNVRVVAPALTPKQILQKIDSLLSLLG